jgi:methanogenic corrinoid protein MtbC1
MAAPLAIDRREAYHRIRLTHLLSRHGGAQAMPELSGLASSELSEHVDVLAESIVARQYSRQKELWKPYGEVGRARAVRYARNHIEFLANAVGLEEPGLFVDYSAWCKVVFHHRELPDSALATTLECTREIVAEILPAALTGAVLPVVAAAIDYLPLAPVDIDSFISSDKPYGSLAANYLARLLEGNRSAAGYLIGNAMGAGAKVEDMHLHVFQPCQWELGRLWQMNRITVADEHYCTAATQLIMSQLYGYIFGGSRNELKMVSTCVGDEMHEIGARMVSDLFELNGWDTHYLGANVPAESVASTIEKFNPDVLAISATLVSHVSAVKNLIRQVRESPAGARAKILVGGHPFRIAPGLWQKVRADATGVDALQALQAANGLLDTT